MLVGVLLGLGASACWALANVAIARAGRLLGSLRALLWAQLCGVAMAAIASAAIEHPSLTLAGLAARGGWIGVACLSSLLAYVCMFYAFEHAKLTVAVPIMSSWAVISAALSIALFGERLGGAQLGGAAAVVAGALVVSRYAQAESAASAGGSTPLLAAVGAALGFGVLIPAMARLAPAFGSIGSIGIVYVGDIALGLPLALAFRVVMRPPAGAAWLPVLAAGLFETAGFACITIGSRLAPVALVSPFASLASALTVLYAWTILRERPARAVLVGAGLVCAGVVVLAL